MCHEVKEIEQQEIYRNIYTIRSKEIARGVKEYRRNVPKPIKQPALFPLKV
jgi:hypothetical protein